MLPFLIGKNYPKAYWNGYQVGPYPADHGEAHVKNLLSNLIIFLTSYDRRALFDNSEKCELLAAGMIHDTNMIHMRLVGGYGHASETARQNHSDAIEMREKALKILCKAGFTQTSAEHIVEIAASHAGDNESTADQKLEQLKQREQKTRKKNLVKFAVLVQVADFFDLGPERLTKDVEKQDWDEKQISHIKKHMTMRKEFKENSTLITLYLGTCDKIKVKGKSIEITPLDRYKIIFTVCEEAKVAIERLNEQFDNDPVWKTECEETLFGKISPSDIFKKEFQNAHDVWRKERCGVFPVYFMGHSLYGRFIEDEEGLNENLKNLFSDSLMNLRVLILDPEVENQQMCEVFDAQQEMPKERGRSILPLYDENEIIGVRNEDGSSIENKGDIVESLYALMEWEKKVKGSSSLEVRTTTQLMYMSLCRFGDSIIVTPYRKKGLFKESLALLFKKGAPLFDAFNEVFDDIWESRFDTTIKLVKYHDYGSYNPVKHFLTEHQIRPENKHLFPLDYERFVLDKHIDRIKAVFDAVHSGKMEYASTN